jgi:phosphatidylethanolamine/phosphatidyl-N-methylethanolamine N-methyltransferase
VNCSKPADPVQVQQVAAYWDRMASVYEAAMKNARGYYRQIIALAGTRVKATDALVDIAAGTGAVSMALALLVREVWAGNLAPGMVEIMRREARRLQLDNVQVTMENAQALSYPDGRFDVAVLCAALHLLPNPVRTMNEVRRVLKPGGLLITTAFLSGHSLMSRLGNALMQLNGYRDRQRWNDRGFMEFIEKQGFRVVEKKLIPVFPIPVQYVAALAPETEEIY